MRTYLCLSLASLFVVPAAIAVEKDSAPDDARAFQVARRVASSENGQEPLSRALWLSTRVVRNSRSLAFHDEKRDQRKDSSGDSATDN